jgi:hypothetical protein
VSKKISLPRSRMWRTRAAAALAAAGALGMSSGLVLLSAPTASAEPEKVHKSYVCKYVSIPGEAERLQTGDNPIWVDNNSLPGYKAGQVVKNGDVFVDKHDKSVVVFANTAKMSPEPGVSVCPSPNPPPPPGGDEKRVVVCKFTGTPPGTAHHIIIVDESSLKNTPYVAPPDGDSWTDAHGQTTEGSIALRYAAPGEQAKDVPLPAQCGGGTQKEPKTPAGITTSDPCGPNNVTWAAKPDPYFDYALSNGVVTATLKDPSKYTVSGTTTFPLPADSNVPCEQLITPPGAPQVLDPCNGPGVTSNNSFVLPADTATLNWESGPNGSVTVAPQPTYTFSGSSQLISFPLPADSGTLCPLGVQEVAPAVSFQDPTCKKLNGSAWKGELTDIIDYTVTGTPGLGADVTVDAAIKPDLADEYEFVDGAVTSFSHGYPTLAELDCIKGEETIVPKPSKEPKPDNEPTVLGTQAAVPTAVAAGLGGTSSDVGTTTQLIAQLLVAGGMLLLMAGGWIGLGRRESGAHQA